MGLFFARLVEPPDHAILYGLVAQDIGNLFSAAGYRGVGH